MRHLATLLGLALCAATPLGAQWGGHVAAGLGATREIVRARAGGGGAAARFTGTVLGGEAVVRRGQFSVRLRYAQGRVTSDAAARDVAEGAALLGYAPRSWLAISAGPEARTFIAPGLSDRRWLFWTARARGRGAIFPGRLDSFVEVWQGLGGGRLSRPATPARGGGLELGLEARLPGRPLWGRLAYRIDQGRASGGIKETVEGFTLTLGGW